MLTRAALSPFPTSFIAVAENFKAQGNEAYRQGPLKLRDALEFYTRALAAKSSDVKLNATCLLNRAQVHLDLKNYGSAKRDCHDALRLDPSNVKGHYRLTRAHHALGQLDDALVHCMRGLDLEADNSALLTEKGRIERDLASRRAEEEKKAAAKVKAEAQAKAEADALAGALRTRKYRFTTEADQMRFRSKADGDKKEERTIASAIGHTVTLHEDGTLHWPVFFVYPEYQVSELVSDFGEDDTFAEHLQMMMSERAPWDVRGTYKADKLVVCFEARKEEQGKTVIALAQIGQATKLKDVLAHKSYFIVDRTPSFLIMEKDSEFHKHFVAKYKQPIVAASR